MVSVFYVTPCINVCFICWCFVYSIKTLLQFQQVSNSILLLTANILGLTSYLVEDKQQRRAFLETRQSLEMKLVIEEQSAEQVSMTPLIIIIRGWKVRFADTFVMFYFSLVAVRGNLIC
jgi:hypothetical protein